MRGILLRLVALALPGLVQPAPQAGTELLSIPVASVLRCRLTPAEALHQLTVHMRIGRETDPVTRDIDVSFDSAGHPVTLIDVIMILDRDHGAVMHTASARISGSAVAGFTVVHERQWNKPEDRFAPIPKGSMPGKYVALSDAEKSRARALAAWVWEHRCPASGSPAARKQE
jgi:hypothetical protein